MSEEKEEEKRLGKILRAFFNNIRLMVSAYVTMIVVCGCVFSFVEKKSIADGVWWAIITSLSIGYGDFYPVTLGGRIDATVVGVVGILLVGPMIVGLVIKDVLNDLHQFTDFEQKLLLARTAMISASLDAAHAEIDALHTKIDIVAEMCVKIGEALNVDLAPLMAQMPDRPDHSEVMRLQADVCKLEAEEKRLAAA